MLEQGFHQVLFVRLARVLLQEALDHAKLVKGMRRMVKITDFLSCSIVRLAVLAYHLAIMKIRCRQGIRYSIPRIHIQLINVMVSSPSPLVDFCLCDGRLAFHYLDGLIFVRRFFIKEATVGQVVL